MVVVPNFGPGGIGFGLAEIVAEEFSLAAVPPFSFAEEGERLQETAPKRMKLKHRIRNVFILMNEPSANLRPRNREPARWKALGRRFRL